MKVAATQMNIMLGDVVNNFKNAVALIQEAAAQDADLIVLPEFFTSGMAINPIINEVHELNKKNRILEKLKDLSTNFKIIISGSILQEINGNIYNSIFIIEPDNKIFIHNKDLPTQFENCYYTYGDQSRNYKKFGVAFCWEMLRKKTILELNDEIELLLCGSCWWDLPIESKNDELRTYNHNLNIITPQKFAEIAGLPVVHSSLKGIIEGEKDLNNQAIVKRNLIGTTQIIDAYGNILNSIKDTDENAVIIEEVKLKKRIKNTIDESYWLIKLRDEYIEAWNTQNELGREIYKNKYKKNLM